MGKAYRRKKQAKKLVERGWTMLAPGIWQGQPIRPFIGPLRKEDQAQIDHWKKVFTTAIAKANEDKD